MQWRGNWAGAMEEAKRACDLPCDPPGQPTVGLAFYELGELHRLRGEFAEAEAAYREATRHGPVSAWAGLLTPYEHAACHVAVVGATGRTRRHSM